MVVVGGRDFHFLSTGTQAHRYKHYVMYWLNQRNDENERVSKPGACLIIECMLGVCRFASVCECLRVQIYLCVYPITQNTLTSCYYSPPEDVICLLLWHLVFVMRLVSSRYDRGVCVCVCVCVLDRRTLSLIDGLHFIAATDMPTPLHSPSI